MPRAARGELGLNPSTRQRVTMGWRVVGPVTLNQARPARRVRTAATYGGHGVDERQRLRDVVSVCGGSDRDERNPVRVGERDASTRRCDDR